VFGTDDPTGRSLLFMLSNLLFNVASIPFTMCLSTLFSDGKVADAIGGILVWVPILIPLQLLSNEGWTRYLIYVFNLLPGCSAIVVWTSLINDGHIPYNKLVINLEDIHPIFAWAFLFNGIFVWYLFYIYLDQVMPSTFGVQRSCCFCLERKSKMRTFKDFESNDLEKPDKKIFDPEDPILV